MSPNGQAAQLGLRVGGAAIAARHSSKSNEHYTPPEIVEPARATLGAIDLDPASCALANTVVRAAHIYTEADNGLEQQWWERCFWNPPGGVDGGESSQKLWWFYGVREWLAGRMEAGIFVGFSIEVLQTTQVKRPRGLPVPAELPHCFPSRRIAYLKNENGVLVPGTSPPHASVIVYLPPRTSREAWAEGMRRFADSFGTVGALCGELSVPARVG
jgi:ParB family chromosome partitioning protein